MDDLVKRLRNTPNWKREDFGHYKSTMSHYDRAPFEAANRIEALEAENARLRAAMEWQPIETAPKDEDAPVLLYVWGMVVCAYWNPKAVVRGPISHAGQVGCFYDPVSGAAYPDATHWQPLPAAPEGEG